MRLPRMTTRRWMVAVAIVGIGVGGWIQIVRWGRLREYYEALAEMHAESASHFRQDADRTREEQAARARTHKEHVQTVLPSGSRRRTAGSRTLRAAETGL
jgi:hypothetical protein